MTRSDGVWISVAAAVFVLAATWRLDLPGLQYDESADAAPAVNFVTNTYKTEPMQINPSIIHLFGRPLPVMVMTYMGPVKELLYIPWFFAFGISVCTLRLLPVMAIAVCFPLTYHLATQLISRRAAQITVALMALDPAFVFYLTRDVGPAALQVLFKLLAVVLLFEWWKREKSWLFGLAFFVLGLGISHKVDFLWVIGGIAGAGLAALRSNLWKRLHRETMGWGFAGACIGAAPVIAFNVATGGLTFSPLFAKFLGEASSTGGTSFLENFGARVLQTARILNGEHLSTLFTEQGMNSGLFGYVMPSFALLSLISLVLFRKHRRPVYYEALVGLGAFIAIVFLASCFSPGALNGHHLLALSPGLHLVMSSTIVRATKLVGDRFHFEKMIVGALVILHFVSVARIYENLRATGGVRSWSDAIYDLNPYLQRTGTSIVAVDWGFTLNLLVLSRGTLEITRAYREYWMHPATAKTIAPYLNDSSTYLAHTGEFDIVPGATQAFAAAAESLGYIIRTDTSFFQGDGRKIFLLQRLERRR